VPSAGWRDSEATRYLVKFGPAHLQRKKHHTGSHADLLRRLAALVWRVVAASTDDLSRLVENRLCDSQPNCLGGLDVDHEIETRRPLHRQVRRSGAREDPGDVPCRPAIRLAGCAFRVAR
jgi:hypothetical protein